MQSSTLYILDSKTRDLNQLHYTLNIPQSFTCQRLHYKSGYTMHPSYPENPSRSHLNSWVSSEVGSVGVDAVVVECASNSFYYRV